MSLIAAVSTVGQPSGGLNTSNTQPKASDPAPPSSSAQPKGDANAAGGGTTTAETTQTGSRVPPVTASRAANATSDARGGGDGQLAAPGEEVDAKARLDKAMARELDEAQAKFEAEAAQRKLIQKELLSRIPVPVEAIPKLTGDVEQVRSIDAQREPDQASG